MPEVRVNTAALIADDAHFLLVREGDSPYFGLPGGGLHPGETIPEGAAREVREETGYVVEVGEVIGIYHEPRTFTGNAVARWVLEARWLEGRLTPSDKHPEIDFFNMYQIEELQARGLIVAKSALQAIVDYTRPRSEWPTTRTL